MVFSSRKFIFKPLYEDVQVWGGALRSWSSGVVFSNEHKNVKNSVWDSLEFISKYYEFLEKYLAVMTKICMKPALYVKLIVWDFLTVPEHIRWYEFPLPA